MIPLTIGFLVTGPLAGTLSDRYGSRLLATGGLVISGATFLLLELLPINFSYIWFALLVFMFAVGMGLFFAPNQAAVMNSLPPDQRGAGAGDSNLDPVLLLREPSPPLESERTPAKRQALR